jgi:biotin operon repressor
MKYQIKLNEKLICEANSMKELALLLGCTRAHVLNQIRANKNNTFKFLRVEYTLIKNK